jgi:hypothetical protein
VAEIKTKKTGASVSDFLDSISEAQKREDCRAIVKMIQAATKADGAAAEGGSFLRTSTRFRTDPA